MSISVMNKSQVGRGRIDGRSLRATRTRGRLSAIPAAERVACRGFCKRPPFADRTPRPMRIERTKHIRLFVLSV